MFYNKIRNRLSILLLILSGSLSAFTHSFLLSPTPTWTESKISLTQLQSSSSIDSDSAPTIRFLGKGTRAVVRPGVVLVAPAHEYNHFLMRSVVFVHAIGVDDDGQHVTRGVIIDHPTAFTMGEMSGGSVYGLLAQNILFQGGDVGNDSAMLLHSCGKDPLLTEMQEDSCHRIECGEMIGTSGIYEGGLQTAMNLVDDGVADPDNFKFFFNYVEFRDKELESMLDATDSEGDAWSSFEVSPDFTLSDEYSRGQAWSYLRNKLKQMKAQI